MVSEIRSEYAAGFSPERRKLLELLLQKKGEGSNSYPLSFAQQRLWFLERLEAGRGIYNVPWARRLSGPLRVRGLEQSLREIVERHESLRTTFSLVDGQPVQIIGEAKPVHLVLSDLTDLDPTDREAEAEREVQHEARQPFDLEVGPLFRARLLKLDEEEHVLLLTLHHIISDGLSLGILLKELATLYNAFVGGEAAPLKALPIQYADYASWQRERLREEVLSEQLSFWQQQLTGAPALLELPSDRPSATRVRKTSWWVARSRVAVALRWKG